MLKCLLNEKLIHDLCAPVQTNVFISRIIRVSLIFIEFLCDEYMICHFKNKLYIYNVEGRSKSLLIEDYLWFGYKCVHD